MTDSADFTGGAEAVDGGTDWEASVVILMSYLFGDPIGFQAYNNWIGGFEITGGGAGTAAVR